MAQGEEEEEDDERGGGRDWLCVREGDCPMTTARHMLQSKRVCKVAAGHFVQPQCNYCDGDAVTTLPYMLIVVFNCGQVAGGSERVRHGSKVGC